MRTALDVSDQRAPRARAVAVPTTLSPEAALFVALLLLALLVLLL